MTERTSKIYMKFEGKIVQWGNTWLVPADSAIDFLRHVFGQGIWIVGIEGFVVDGKTRRPNMDAIADNCSQGLSLLEFESFIRKTMWEVTHYEFILSEKRSSNNELKATREACTP